MPGRGPQTFKKRQKEQQRKERQMEKMAKRLQRKDAPPASDEDIVLDENGRPIIPEATSEAADGTANTQEGAPAPAPATHAGS